jgi:hypothetical protein
MSYKGRYVPVNRKKYSGDPLNITFRSLWERRVMKYFDESPHIIKWSSEGLIIPYRYDVDKKWHRYFPDFWIEDKNGNRIVIEVKPNKQLLPPNPKRKRTKSFWKESYAYVKNRNKWDFAEEYCKNRGWEFQILTEKDIFGKR